MASNVIDSLESKLLQEATAYQQNYYEICSDWNRYESNELDYLKDYIGYALYGPPEFENEESNEKINEENIESSEKSNKESNEKINKENEENNEKINEENIESSEKSNKESNEKINEENEENNEKINKESSEKSNKETNEKINEENKENNEKINEENKESSEKSNKESNEKINEENKENNEKNDEDDASKRNLNSCHFNYKEKQQKFINTIYEKLMEYGNCEQSEGVVHCAVIYNVIFNKKQTLKAEKERIAKLNEPSTSESKWKNYISTKRKKNTRPESKDEKATSEHSEPRIQIYPVPVFKVKRHQVASEKNESSEESEKIYYIDNSGRVYNGFKDYLENNTLPKCTMVLPKDGRYQIDPIFYMKAKLAKLNLDDIVTMVWLEIHESPASGVAAKLLKGGDVVNTVAFVASMGVGIAGMVTPIGAGIALASGISTGVGSLWAVGRSTQQLADRGLHGESVNVTNREALGAWIGIAGGTMGLAATGGHVLLSRAIRAGTNIGRAATVAYDTVLIGNLVVNGVGLGARSYDIYASFVEQGLEGVSAQDVFFLTTHLFFFCNSVVNTRFTQNMIETSQGQLLKDYETSLRSNRHRKEFQRMARNTRSAGTSDVSSNEEIIRGINKIASKDEFFQSMVRNRKAFSAAGAKVSFSDGKVVVNSIMTIDPIEFANLPKDVRVDMVKSVSSVEPKASTGIKPTVNRVNEVSYKNFTANNTQILKEFCLKHSSAILQSAPPEIDDFTNVLNDLRSVQNSAVIFVKLLEIGYKILQAMPRDEVIRLGDFLASIVQFLWDYIKSNIRRMRPGIMIDDPSSRVLLEKLMQELWLRVEKRIDVWVEAFKEWLENSYPRAINEPFLNDSHNKAE